MSELLPWAGYTGVKLAAYAGWCALGVRQADPSSRYLLKGLGFGLVRLIMGIGFGLVILVGVNIVYASLRQGAAAYLLVYVPVRWLEWSLMALLIDRASRSMAAFWVGRNTPTRLWRLGGIVISCAADIPVILAVGGLPVGRFFC